MTKASNAIEYANVLLVAGVSLNSLTWANMLRYYEGDKLVLINTEEKSGDERARRTIQFYYILASRLLIMPVNHPCHNSRQLSLLWQTLF